MKKNNDDTENYFRDILLNVERHRYTNHKNEDFSQYDTLLFAKSLEVMNEADKYSFKEACSIIGQSLRSDFSEIDIDQSVSMSQNSFSSIISKELRPSPLTNHDSMLCN